MTGKEKLIKDGVLEEGKEDEPIESQIEFLTDVSCPSDYGLDNPCVDKCEDCDKCWKQALAKGYLGEKEV